MASTLWNPHMPHSSNGTATSVTRRAVQRVTCAIPSRPSGMNSALTTSRICSVRWKATCSAPQRIWSEKSPPPVTSSPTYWLSPLVTAASTRQTPAASCSAREYGAAGMAGAIERDSIVWDMANLFSQDWNVPATVSPADCPRTWCN